MTKFDEPIIEVIMFNNKDAITTSTTYNAADSEDNSYINEDEYNFDSNPWA